MAMMTRLAERYMGTACVGAQLLLTWFMSQRPGRAS